MMKELIRIPHNILGSISISESHFYLYAKQHTMYIVNKSCDACNALLTGIRMGISVELSKRFLHHVVRVNAAIDTLGSVK